jgi:hypothetical protein
VGLVATASEQQRIPLPLASALIDNGDDVRVSAPLMNCISSGNSASLREHLFAS